MTKIKKNRKCPELCIQKKRRREKERRLIHQEALPSHAILLRIRLMVRTTRKRRWREIQAQIVCQPPSDRKLKEEVCLAISKSKFKE